MAAPKPHSDEKRTTESVRDDLRLRGLHQVQ